MVAQIERVRAGEASRRLHGFLWQGKQYEGLVVNALEALWATGTELVGPDGGCCPIPGGRLRRSVPAHADPHRAESSLGDRGR